MIVLRILLHCILITCVPALAESTGIDDAKISVYFSPGDPCTTAVVKALDGATSSVRVFAYSFTSDRVAKAIVEAHKRGCSVEVILDKTQRTSTYSSADFLRNSDIATRIDTGFTKAHNKCMVIDDKIVITGSFNFTTAAETKNAENLLVIESPKLAMAYMANYEKLRKTSDVYKGKELKVEAPVEEVKKEEP